MIEHRLCENCNHSYHVIIKCDTCGKEMQFETIKVEFGYGSDLDGENYHFCDYTCVLQFILNELKKQDQTNGEENEKEFEKEN